MEGCLGTTVEQLKKIRKRAIAAMQQVDTSSSISIIISMVCPHTSFGAAQPPHITEPLPKAYTQTLECLYLGVGIALKGHSTELNFAELLWSVAPCSHRIVFSNDCHAHISA